MLEGWNGLPLEKLDDLLDTGGWLNYASIMLRIIGSQEN